MNSNEIRPTYDYKYLQHMIAEKAGMVTTIKTNVVSALEVLENTKTIQDNPQTVKGYASWLGRKLSITEDPILSLCKDTTLLKTQICTRMNNHLGQLGIFNDRKSKELAFNVFPVEVKVLIVNYLDGIFAQDCDNFDIKLRALSNRVMKVPI